MARIFNTNEYAVPVKIGGGVVSLGPREGWQGSLSAASAADARKITGIEVSGEVIQPKPKRKR